MQLQELVPDGYRADGGDGIVIVGGGKYWHGIYVTVKLLREYLNCNLPIEIWYRGDCEKVYPDKLKFDSIKYFDVDAMGRELRDSKIPTGNVAQGGWEAKLYALTHTRLSRVLFLDADAYCVQNPAPLFEYLNNSSFVYWRDLQSQINSIKWANVHPEGNVINVPPVQGGQLLIDRLNAKSLICMAHYMCQNSHYYFKQMYGDQDAWRVGLVALKHNYLCLGNAKWQEVAFLCSFKDTVYIVHRCQGKLFAPSDIPKTKTKYSTPRYHIPMEKEVFKYFNESLNADVTESTSVFKTIYENGLWGVGFASISNPKIVREAAPYVNYVNELIRSNNYETVVDVGCGSGLVASMFKCKNYVGYDCVQQPSWKHFTNRSRKFLTLDIFVQSDKIQLGDILVCKDVLHHWPNAWIDEWLTKLIESNRWKSIVLCQDCNQSYSEEDCYLGGYRALNPAMKPMSKHPFHLISTYIHKAILLWTRQ